MKMLANTITFKNRKTYPGQRKGDNLKSIIAFGRYNTTKSYAHKNGLKLVSLKELMHQSGCYNSEVMSLRLGAIPLNFAGKKDGKEIWFKCWVAVKGD